MTAPASRLSLGLAFAAIAVIWGSTYLGIRVALEAFPPFLMVGLRFVLAGGALYAVSRLRGDARPSARAWRDAAVVGVLLCLLGNGLVVVAEQTVSSGLCAVIVATVPLWGAGIDAALGKPPTRAQWLALGVGLAGIVVLQLGSDLSAGGVGGVVAIVLAPAAWAIGSVLARRAPSDASRTPRTATSVGMQMLAGGAAALVVSFVVREPWPVAVTLAPALALGYLVVFGSIVGFASYHHLLRHASAPVAMSYAYINPIVALALGAAFAGKKMSPGSIAATVLVLAAVAVLRIGESRRSPRTGAAPSASEPGSRQEEPGARHVGPSKQTVQLVPAEQPVSRQSSGGIPQSP